MQFRQQAARCLIRSSGLHSIECHHCLLSPEIKDDYTTVIIDYSRPIRTRHSRRMHGFQDDNSIHYFSDTVDPLLTIDPFLS